MTTWPRTQYHIKTVLRVPLAFVPLVHRFPSG